MRSSAERIQVLTMKEQGGILQPAPKSEGPHRRTCKIYCDLRSLRRMHERIDQDISDPLCLKSVCCAPTEPAVATAIQTARMNSQ